LDNPNDNYSFTVKGDNSNSLLIGESLKFIINKFDIDDLKEERLKKLKRLNSKILMNMPNF